MEIMCSMPKLIHTTFARVSDPAITTRNGIIRQFKVMQMKKSTNRVGFAGNSSHPTLSARLFFPGGLWLDTKRPLSASSRAGDVHIGWSSVAQSTEGRTEQSGLDPLVKGLGQ